MDLNLVRRHWWSVYIALYSILIWPLTRPDIVGNSQSRIFLTFVAVLGGTLLTWTAYPDLRFTSITKIFTFAKTHKAPFIALCYGFWAIISAQFSKTPIIGLLGSLDTNSDGAFWTLMLSVVFFLVYFEVIRDSEIKKSLITTIQWLLVVFVAFSIFEFILKKPFLNPLAAQFELPVLNMGLTENLSGFLVLLTGGVFSFLSSHFNSALFFLLFATFGIGLSVNKFSFIGFFLLSIYHFFRRQHKIALGSLLAVGLGFLLSFGFTSLYNQEAKNTITQKDQYQDRILLYRAATRGILANPILGYGGSQFQNSWMNFLSNAELSKFFLNNFQAKYEKTIQDKNTGISVFLVRNKDNHVTSVSVDSWKAKNQFLDIALMWGIFGLLLYFLLIYNSFKNLTNYNFFSMSIFTYTIYNFFWYTNINIEGIFFIILATSCVSNKTLLEQNA